MTSYLAISFCAVLATCLPWMVGAEDEPAESLITTDPAELRLYEGSTGSVRWGTSLGGVHSVLLAVEDGSILSTSENVFSSESFPNATFSGSFNVSAIFMGYSKVNITLLSQQNEVLGHTALKVSVVVGYQLLNQIYMATIGLLLFVVFINMGCVFDPAIFRVVLKRPVGPLVALFCQFVAMPLIAFGLSKLFFLDDPIYQLGMFLCGTVPGGGTSNMWAYLVGGNFDLSLIMTAVSSIVAFGAIPLWTIVLGPYISSHRDIVVPITDIVLLVLGLIIPVGIGYLIQRFCPKLTRFFEKILTPLILFIFLYTLTFGAYANRYIFQLLDYKIALAALCLPTLGYLVGMCLSLMFKCPKRDVIAISIETGIQNMGLVVFMLNYTLPSPSNTIAIVIPGASAFMTPLPIVVMGVVLHACEGNINRHNVNYILTKISKCEWDFMTPNTGTREAEKQPTKDEATEDGKTDEGKGVQNPAFNKNENV